MRVYESAGALSILQTVFPTPVKKNKIPPRLSLLNQCLFWSVPHVLSRHWEITGRPMTQQDPVLPGAQKVV